MPRQVQLDQNCALRFPGRDEDFAAGVEIGMLATLMDLGHWPIERCIHTANMDQARELAEAFEYRLVEGRSEGEWTPITLAPRSVRPKLVLVSS